MFAFGIFRTFGKSPMSHLATFAETTFASTKGSDFDVAPNESNDNDDNQQVAHHLDLNCRKNENNSHPACFGVRAHVPEQFTQSELLHAQQLASKNFGDINQKPFCHPQIQSSETVQRCFPQVPDLLSVLLQSQLQPSVRSNSFNTQPVEPLRLDLTYVPAPMAATTKRQLPNSDLNFLSFPSSGPFSTTCFPQVSNAPQPTAFSSSLLQPLIGCELPAFNTPIYGTSAWPRISNAAVMDALARSLL
mmetsp:Transcript_2621/g.7327  ORF Transcript_2621/g.7327 Transcript_2621/m.7327 type:complete len:247 (+) Transcript_2621:338-1078(+)